MKTHNLVKIVLALMILTFTNNYVKGQNSDTIVWPGDVNNNGVVNQFDLLYIGAAYNSQGAPREEISIAWNNQFIASNWPFLLNQTFNAAYADCNGDGFVDDNDIEAVEVNYGLTHSSIFPDSFPEANNIGETDILFDTMNIPPQGASGQAFTIPISLGEENFTLENIYSLAFNMTVNTDFVDLGSLSFDIDPTWIDSDNSGLLEIQKKNFNDNTFDIALSRRNFEATAGGGTIGYVSFVIIDNVPDFAPDTEVLTFGETTVLNNNLEQVYRVEQGKLLINFTNPTNELPRSEFSIYPNPVKNGVCLIEGLENYPDAEIRLLDMVGREMNVSFIGNELQVSHLPSGIYFININTSKGRLTEKVIINNSIKQ